MSWAWAWVGFDNELSLNMNWVWPWSSVMKPCLGLQVFLSLVWCCHRGGVVLSLAWWSIYIYYVYNRILLELKRSTESFNSYCEVSKLLAHLPMQETISNAHWPRRLLFQVKNTDRWPILKQAKRTMRTSQNSSIRGSTREHNVPHFEPFWHDQANDLSFTPISLWQEAEQALL